MKQKGVNDMFQGFDTEDSKLNDFHQRVADQNIQSFDTRNDDILVAKNGFIGMLAGILVGGVVGWLFLSPANQPDDAKTIPVIRRPLTPFKVQPNDPGGMNIDNQDREIYHIVDNQPKVIDEVKIVPSPDTPKLVVEHNINNTLDMESLVDSISDKNEDIIDDTEETIQVAHTQLEPIATNSTEKVAIPEKIENIKVDIQDSINTEKTISTPKEETAPLAKKVEAPVVPQSTAEKSAPKTIKGTWYAQIIASSSRKSVENLWQKLSSTHNFLKTYPYSIEEITSSTGSKLYRLKVGSFKTRKEAEQLSLKLKQNKISSIIKQN